MLYLRTGLPGAGKTLNAIREIDIEHQPDPDDPSRRLHKDPDDPDLPPRTIYYYGILDLKLDKLKSRWVEFDTPEQWYALPDGSVIVIDEAQRVFGNDGSRARPEKVARFETHRHQGLDIHLITQHPSLLSAPVRKLAGKHINFIRPYGRLKGIFRHEYEFCIDNPERRSNFKQAQEEKVSLDPSYFGTYKSSTIHTHKPIRPSYLKNIPFLVLFILSMVGLLGYMLWWVISSERANQDEFRSKIETGTVGVIDADGLPAGEVNAVGQPGNGDSSTPERYVTDLLPRIPDFPASAPRYDDLARPRDFPRPICAASGDANLVARAPERRIAVGTYNGRAMMCQCYTQQVTRLQTTFEFCMDVVINGYFDDSRNPPTYASGNSSRGPITSSSSSDLAASVQRGPAAAQTPPGSRLTIVPDTEFASRPWR